MKNNEVRSDDVFSHRQTLDLRKIDDAVATQQTSLSRYKKPIVLSHGTGRVTIALEGPLPTITDEPWLLFTIGGMKAALQLSYAQARRAVQLPLQDLPGAEAGILLEAALEGWLNVAERASELTFRFEELVEDIAQYSTLRVAASLRIEGVGSDGAAFRMRRCLRLSSDAAKVLAEKINDISTDRDEIKGLFIPLKLQIDSVLLPLDDLRRLKPGMGFLISSETKPRLKLSGGGQALCSYITYPNSVRLETGIIPTSTAERNSPMGDTIQNFEVDEIDVVVSFTAGEIHMTVGQLRGLAAGSIIETTAIADAAVEVLANGRRIGIGELVDVAGRRAVEIRTLFSNAEG
jgi:type III secretion protein Q